jgi:hypothetical protein
VTPPLDDLSARLRTELLAFARTEWVQMGARLPRSARTSPWAQDPEALILFTLDVGRDDPNLRYATFDWLAKNEGIVSARRLRTLSGEDPLADAVLTWLASRRRGRIPETRRSDAERAFQRAGLPTTLPKIDFVSSAPRLTAPINLAFRLREFLGVGARAEAVRLLLTHHQRVATASELAMAAGYTGRNVHEALTSLAQAGVGIERYTVRHEQSFALDRDHWAAMLGLETIPPHRSWPALLNGLRLAVKRLPTHDETAAIELAGELRKHFSAASVLTAASPEDPSETIRRAVQHALALLQPDESPD